MAIQIKNFAFLFDHFFNLPKLSNWMISQGKDVNSLLCYLLFISILLPQLCTQKFTFLWNCVASPSFQVQLPQTLIGVWEPSWKHCAFQLYNKSENTIAGDVHYCYREVPANISISEKRNALVFTSLECRHCI